MLRADNGKTRENVWRSFPQKSPANLATIRPLFYRHTLSLDFSRLSTSIESYLFKRFFVFTLTLTSVTSSLLLQKKRSQNLQPRNHQDCRLRISNSKTPVLMEAWGQTRFTHYLLSHLNWSWVRIQMNWIVELPTIDWNFNFLVSILLVLSKSFLWDLLTTWR